MPKIITIGIDGNEANIQNRVGVGQFAYKLLVNLYKIDHHNRYIIYLKNQPLTDLPLPRENWEYRCFGPSKLWTKFALPLRLYTQKEKLDLFYSPSHYSPQFSPFPIIPTIHDLGYLKYPQQFNKNDLYQLVNWTKRSIFKAKHIVTVSNFSKTEIEKTYGIDGNKITIAYNGVDNPPSISSKQSLSVLKKFNINRPFVLYLGTLKPNKNIPFLINSFSLLLENPQFKNYSLVIAGKKGWLFDEIFNTVKSKHLEKKIIFTDYINETEKWALYTNADFTVIPSIYEGFGIPAVESMKVGTPVIVSDIPSLKEVIGKAGLVCDPTDIQNLCRQMIEITKPEVKSKLSKLGLSQTSTFTWENTARSVLSVFDKVCFSNQH